MYLHRAKFAVLLRVTPGGFLPPPVFPGSLDTFLRQPMTTLPFTAGKEGQGP